MKIIFPPPLRRGDVIGLVSPASTVDNPSSVDRAVHHLEALGYRVEVGAHLMRTHGYLAGTDEERAADIHGMFSDTRVKAIISLRGGYGAPRLLPLLDYRLIARHPKIFVGFSDITALLLALWKKCRLVTFHGPMAAVDWGGDVDPFSEDLFWRLVSSTHALGRLPAGDVELAVHVGGKATGRLLGGNLSLLVSLLGTPYQPDFARCILFLEDVDEEPFRIDRMLTQLRNAAVFSDASAILTGQFSHCTPRDQSKPSLTMLQILDEIVVPSAKPFISNLPFGHVRKKLTLPLGLRISVDADKREIALLESAVG